MYGKKIILSVAISLFLLACPIHAVDQCTSYKYIHVKLDTSNSVMEEFHGTDESNHDNGAFFVEKDYFDEDFKCGIFLHAVATLSARPVAVVWSGVGGKLNKEGTGSMSQDLKSYHACSNSECSNPACKSGNLLSWPPTLCHFTEESGEAGAAGPYGTGGADTVFEMPYGEVKKSVSDVSFAATSKADPAKKMYSPKYDILCGEDGKWHTCDIDGCQCLPASSGGAYYCNNGVWSYCEYPCVEEGGKAVCKEPKKNPFCADQALEATEPNNVLSNPPQECPDFGVTFLGFKEQASKATVLVKINYPKGEDTQEIIMGEDHAWKYEDEDTKIAYTVLYKGADGDKAVINACCEKPEIPPAKEPLPPPQKPPEKVVPPEEQEEPIPKTEPVPYTEPETKCEEYWGTIKIRGESTENPTVEDPCGYTKTITVDATPNLPVKQACAKVGGTVDDKDYAVIDIPPCSSSMQSFGEIGEDIFGNIFGEKEKAAVEGDCLGEIDNVYHHIDLNTRGIEVGVDYTNTGKEKCTYKACIYAYAGSTQGTEGTTSSGGSEDPWKEETCAEQQTLEPGESATATISSQGSIIDFFKNLLKGDMQLRDLLGWNIDDLNKRYNIKIKSWKEGGTEEVVDSKESVVCQDQVFQLCGTTAVKIDKQIDETKEVPQEVYGVVDSLKYVGLANKKIEDYKNQIWLLDIGKFVEAEVKDCIKSGDSEQLGTGAELDIKPEDELKTYTIINDPKYRTFVENNFGEEVFYKKYSSMYEKEYADYLYCYKTDMKDTSFCKDFSLQWYSLGMANSQRYIEPAYISDIRQWNRWQDVNEITPVDMGKPKPDLSYEPSPCSVAMDRDYYLPDDNISITYTNAPPKASLTLSYWDEGEEQWKKVEQEDEWESVSGDGNRTYKLDINEKRERWKVELNKNSCMVSDEARIGISAMSNLMSKAFMITPFLEDLRNKVYWTKTGKGTLYAASGFERYDTCELSCAAKNKENCRLSDGCTPAMGAYPEDCSHCIDSGDCTIDSKGVCGGPKGDCWDNVCEVKSLYRLEAEPNKDSYYGIPYKNGCPEGFTDPKKAAQQPVATFHHSWENQYTQETKCVLEGGVLGITKFDFKGEIAKKADMVFIVDTSTSITDPGEEWETICSRSIIQNAVKRLKDAGVQEVRYTAYALVHSNRATMISCQGIDIKPLVCDQMNQDLGVSMACESWEQPYMNCAMESWGNGVRWAMKYHDWMPDAKKLIFPISDEDADCGGEYGDKKDGKPYAEDGADEIEAAISEANGASVYGLWGNNAGQIVMDEMKRLSTGTGGEAHLFTDEKEVEDILVKSVSTETVVVSTEEVKKQKVEGKENAWELYQEHEPVETTVMVPKPAKEKEKKQERILIYVINDYYVGFDMADNVRALGYEVDFKIRSGKGELAGEDFKKALDPESQDAYTQLWLINGGEDGEPGKDVYLSEEEKQVIYDFRETGGDILISVDNDQCSGGAEWQTYQRVLDEVSNHYGLDYSGCWVTGGSSIGPYCLKDGENSFKMEEHPIWVNDEGEKVNVVSTTDSDAHMTITNSKIKALAHLNGEPYGVALLDEGVEKGRILFDNSFARFYTNSDACEASDDALYHRNVAKWLAWELEPPVETEEVKMKVLPSLHVVDTGNMPFEITYANFSKGVGGEYVLTRIYRPEDPSRKLVVTSDVDLNYTLLETAQKFTVDVNTTYVTLLRRLKMYTACDYVQCTLPSGSTGYTYDRTSCGGISQRQDTGQSRNGILTEVIELNESEQDELNVPGISRTDIACNTLNKLEITGTIDQYIDNRTGTLVMESALDDPLTIKISPDILGGFIMRVNKSYITYQGLVYPTRHYLSRKQGSPYPDVGYSSLDDRYRFEDALFGFPQQCRKICPAYPGCQCTSGRPLEPQCIDLNAETLTWVKRTDCSCIPEDCYPNPCVSRRSFHEEEGSVIANGDFETGALEPIWKKTGGEAAVELYGLSGYRLRLNGVVEQDIPALNTEPSSQLCLEYGINVNKKEGSIDVTATVDGNEKAYNFWKYEEGPQGCENCLGWHKNCVELTGKSLTKIKIESTTEVLIDNVNLGAYYDFVGLYTYEVPLIEYMDQPTRNWEYTGLLKTDGVTHTKDTYRFNFRTFQRISLGTTAQNPVAGLVPSDVRKGDMTIQTFFGDIVVPLTNTAEKEEDKEGSADNVNQGEQEQACYSVDLKIREPTKLLMETTPSGWAIPRGTKVTVKAKLVNALTGEPLSGEKVYFDLAGKDIWRQSPEGLSRDYMFNLDELPGKEDQQKNVLDYIKSFQDDDLTKAFEGAKYSKEGDKIVVRNNDVIVGTIESKDGTTDITLASGENIPLGVNGDEETGEKNVYVSDAQEQYAYAVTDGNGEIAFKLIPTGTTVNGYAAGGAASPSSASTGLHTIQPFPPRSPLISAEFLLLAAIFIFAVFSYRFFTEGKMDIGSWWRDYKGRK